jgi:transcription elongation GreA/GreB family factor
LAIPVYLFSLAVMTFKETIYNYYLQLITLKITEVEKSIVDIKESAANETKSTAGDKHETALAMLQIEEANKREQLKVLQQQKQELQNINPLLVNTTINKGSLVKTNKDYFFVSVALGNAIIDNKAVIALSSQSPLGKALVGLSRGESMLFNTTEYLIQDIL